MGDPRLMSLQQRHEIWADHALAVLMETAAVHQTAITYADLAARVQERSGITTDVPARSWLVKVLTIVGRRTREAEEPDLVSLVVEANGSVGPGYDTVRSALGEPPHGPAHREQAAAEARLACNRRYAPAVPEDAQPLLHPVTTLESLGTRTSRAPKAARAAREPREPRAARPAAGPAARPAARSAKPVEREAAFCPTCFLQLPLSGTCPNCA
ncbi:hypothetical protein [Arsenicicoccus sp. oral taxon 190]|uniref:hypothetical protein n=1 Tax=Arsenicicoccus sp. oral taxon 190 TaxID=1658671 RepID=UPI00067D172F|nr:hypothetical protein [Arsenicicoccus sp. oral taxon 190]